MLDLEQLEKIPLLQAAGWSRSRAGKLRQRMGCLDPRFPPQVPPEAIFPAAWEIIDALEGTLIPNQCSELGLGGSCHAIEFDFLGYDDSVRRELTEMETTVGRRVILLGIGYDIAGDWLVDETGAIWFRNRLAVGKLFPFSPDIYRFLEKDLFGCVDMDGNNIFSGRKML